MIKPYIRNGNRAGQNPALLNYGDVIGYDHAFEGRPRPDGQPHLGIIYDADFQRVNGKRTLVGLGVLTMSIHPFEETLPRQTGRSFYIPKPIIKENLRGLDFGNKYMAELHIAYVPLHEAYLGLKGGVRTVGSFAGTERGEAIFMAAQKMGYHAMRREMGMDYHTAMMISGEKNIAIERKFSQSAEEYEDKLGAPIMSEDDYGMAPIGLQTSAPKEKKTVLETPYPRHPVKTPRGKAPLIDALEKNPDSLALLLETGSIHKKSVSFLKRLRTQAELEKFNEIFYYVPEEMEALKDILAQETMENRFEFMRLLDYFTRDLPDTKLDHITALYGMTMSSEKAEAFQHKNKALVAFVQDLMEEGATMEEILSRSEKKVPKMIPLLQEAILAAGHLKYVSAPAPVVEAAPDLIKAFEEKRSKMYDIALHDLVDFVRPGGEMAGIARLRGGADHDAKEALPVLDPKSGEEMTILTLREAWDYLNTLSPEGNAVEISQSLNRYGSIGLASTEKFMAKIKTLFAALNDIHEENGAPHTDNPDMAKIVESGRVFAI